ncbi:hypothetical protein [Mesorhizobium sp. B4-1-4]|uniref:hypothetical protein n=1 Tax=Mesorhizobium sp. B4-1-4 TaxID=2589888 RepID=UPI00112D18B8|nr:hypothetical protein [Mesorhizobium sp. B4-1-4]UCI33262.1 hypothetical protein FJW03_07485 [Mesorhizobium sp. B4-1-4]
MQMVAGLRVLMGTLAMVTPTRAGNLEDCSAYGHLAYTIMKQRQSGIDMSVLMSILEKKADGAAKRQAQQLVIDAYDTPLFEIEENKQRTISEFANKAQVYCYQSKGSQ